jgi:hypothetical protein
MKTRMLVLVFVCLSLGALRASAQAINCNPVNVATFSNRVHVRCNPGSGAIVFFAVSSANAAAAQRFQDLAVAALVNNKTLFIQFNAADTTTGPAFGCLSSDCRPALGTFINK